MIKIKTVYVVIAIDRDGNENISAISSTIGGSQLQAVTTKYKLAKHAKELLEMAAFKDRVNVKFEIREFTKTV